MSVSIRPHRAIADPDLRPSWVPPRPRRWGPSACEAPQVPSHWSLDLEPLFCFLGRSFQGFRELNSFFSGGPNCLFFWRGGGEENRVVSPKTFKELSPCFGADPEPGALVSAKFVSCQPRFLCPGEARARNTSHGTPRPWICLFFGDGLRPRFQQVGKQHDRAIVFLFLPLDINVFLEQVQASEELPGADCNSHIRKGTQTLMELFCFFSVIVARCSLITKTSSYLGCPQIPCKQFLRFSGSNGVKWKPRMCN